jgi:prepilin-type N-terminal cleavage/methylation domain-containing protein
MSKTRGFQLVEMLAVLAIVGLLTSFAVAPLLRLSAATRVRSAAEEMVGVLRSAKSYAIVHSANVGVKFSTLPNHTVVWRLYRDGDGDGVLTADIRSGVDPAVTTEQRLMEFGNTVRFGFPPGTAPRDPSNPRKRMTGLDDPLRFNLSDIASFDPLGGATPGSAYLTDGQTQLVAVRVLGLTGKVKVLTYDRRKETWR